MHVSNTLGEWRARRQALEGRRIGFVPTMGALHRGHSSLVERCRAESDVVAVTIFVNPTQFNESKDLDRYPRTIDEDLSLLEKLRVDEVIVPSAPELYPHGYRSRIEPHDGDLVLEGGCRPGFLQGVLTVVLKLLNLVRPSRAYFGEKDYQQLRFVTEMAQEFFLPVEIIACPTVREDSGLAMSSRNTLLSLEDRNRAAYLYRTLRTALTCSEARTSLEAHGFRVEYVEERWARRLAAVRLGEVRLIDNVPVDEVRNGLSS